MFYRQVLLSIIVLPSIWAGRPGVSLETGPKSYKLSFDINNQHQSYTQRKISLQLDDKQAGYVEYNISKDKSVTSFINYLYVEKEFRGSRGCGKILLCHAIKDILANGSTQIELQRFPFDLLPTDNFKIRDEQLKNWYGLFGFIEKKEQNRYMRLADFNKFFASDISTYFSNNGLQFANGSNLKKNLI